MRSTRVASHTSHHFSRFVLRSRTTLSFYRRVLFAPFDSLRSLRIVLLRKTSIVSVALSLGFTSGIME